MKFKLLCMHLVCQTTGCRCHVLAAGDVRASPEALYKASTGAVDSDVDCCGCEVSDTSLSSVDSDSEPDVPLVQSAVSRAVSLDVQTVSANAQRAKRCRLTGRTSHETYPRCLVLLMFCVVTGDGSLV